jgi:hypothetical protein
MRLSIHSLTTFIAVTSVILMPLTGASADDSKDRSQRKADRSSADGDTETPALNLLDAMRDRLVSVQAEGMGDGRMTMAVTNRTKRHLRVVLPIGTIAQGATGQFGGLGGLGGGFGGGIGGGGIGGGNGGVGGIGGGNGGVGGVGVGGMGNTPPLVGMLMISRIIISVCGDNDSWDQRSLGIGMGGMRGGMVGGMRSVPPTSLPFADLKPGQTRHLPTRLVSLGPPDPETGLTMPAKGEPLKIGHVSDVGAAERVQKALKRLAADKAPQSVSQLVLWRLSSDLSWESIHQMSSRWANPFELTLAHEFVDRLDSLPDKETGMLLFQVDAADQASVSMVDEVRVTLHDKQVLGLHARVGTLSSPESPAVACQIRLGEKEAHVQVAASDKLAASWVPVGKFTLPIVRKLGKLQSKAFAGALAEGILSRLVRAQLAVGPRAKGKLTYRIRIDNASPLILNGLAAVGTASKQEEPMVLWGISIPPWKSMTVPVSEEAVKTLSLRKGIRLVASDLSGL